VALVDERPFEDVQRLRLSRMKVPRDHIAWLHDDAEEPRPERRIGDINAPRDG
jgi:hypothetical protein